VDLVTFVAYNRWTVARVLYFTDQELLVAGRGLIEAAVSVDDERAVDGERIGEVLFDDSRVGPPRMVVRESTVVDCCAFWISGEPVAGFTSNSCVLRKSTVWLMVVATRPCEVLT
jgi:hypothetical protein